MNNLYNNNYKILTSSTSSGGGGGISPNMLSNSSHGSTNSQEEEKHYLSFKLMPAVGGFILEVYKTVDSAQNMLTGYASSVNRYIIKEKNIGKQIEKILAIELLKK